MSNENIAASSGTDLDQLRAEFEALVAGNANVARAPTGAYLAIATHLQWLGFQLARRASPQPVAVDEQMKSLEGIERFTVPHVSSRGEVFVLVDDVLSSQHPSAAPSAQAADDHARDERARRLESKLDAVWANLRAMAERYSGKPCEGEPLDALDAMLRATQPPTAPVLHCANCHTTTRRADGACTDCGKRAFKPWTEIIRPTAPVLADERAKDLANVIDYLVANGHMRWEGFDNDDEPFSSDNAEFQEILSLVKRALDFRATQPPTAPVLAWRYRLKGRAGLPDSGWKTTDSERIIKLLHPAEEWEIQPLCAAQQAATCQGGAQQAGADVLEFVQAVAHNFDVYDEADQERYCRGCSALVVENGKTNHQPDCIVPRAQAWLARKVVAPVPVAAEDARDDRIANYKPGQWFDAHSLDEMQAFYLSRLPAIREAAKEHGYAIGLHGSTRRDFDLMAMQWREDASPKDTLAHAISEAACGISLNGCYAWEKKPNGRFAVSMPICWTDHGNPEFGDKLSLGHIDLSVMDPSWMILLIDKRAEDYLRDNAETDPDTGSVLFNYGEAGREYHSTLTELADELRAAMSSASANGGKDGDHAEG